jgi:hypothetical protein
MNLRRSSPLLFFLFICSCAWSQEATLYGVVKDDNGVTLPSAYVVISSLNIGTSTDSVGQYELTVPANTEFLLESRFSNYATFSKLMKLEAGERKKQNITLRISELITVEIIDDAIRKSTMERIQPKLQRKIPSPAGGIESLLIGQLGVSSNN